MQRKIDFSLLSRDKIRLKSNFGAANAKKKITGPRGSGKKEQGARRPQPLNTKIKIN